MPLENQAGVANWPRRQRDDDHAEEEQGQTPHHECHRAEVLGFSGIGGQSQQHDSLRAEALGASRRSRQSKQHDYYLEVALGSSGRADDGNMLNGEREDTC